MVLSSPLFFIGGMRQDGIEIVPEGEAMPRLTGCDRKVRLVWKPVTWTTMGRGEEGNQGEQGRGLWAPPSEIPHKKKEKLDYM